MPRAVSIERWESDPQASSGRCDRCDAVAQLVRVSTESGERESSPRTLRLCPRCLDQHSKDPDLLKSAKSLYPKVFAAPEVQQCDECGAPATVESCKIEM